MKAQSQFYPATSCSATLLNSGNMPLKMCWYASTPPVSKQCISNDTVHQKLSQSIPSVVLYHMRNFDYVFAFLVLLTGLECMLLKHIHTDNMVKLPNNQHVRRRQ